MTEDLATREPQPLDVHTWFSLTYANYLVVPRSVLQSMPEDWQHRFTALMGEMDQAFGHLDWPAYDVRVLKRPTQINNWPTAWCDDCEGTGRKKPAEVTPPSDIDDHRLWLRTALHMIADENPAIATTAWWKGGAAICGDEDCPTCEGTGRVDDPEGPRYETPEEVGFRDDPIPHYNRGRTKLEPRERETGLR